MINEEEKDAIDVLENVFIFKNTNDRFTKLDLKCINIALNLITTQNKMIDKLETKLMYALTPTNHELALDTQSNFKRIIRENIEDDTYTIRKKSKEYWEKGE